MSHSIEPPNLRLKLRHAIGLIVLAFAGYCLVMPLFSISLSSNYQLVRYWTSVIEHLVDATIGFWFFVLGACLGSFLNVVVYRMPRRLPITGSSFCPNCRTPIRMSDNLPVLAWLKLQGRCRQCGLPISPRYPLVEAAVGAVFFVLSVTTIALAGWNLPVDLPSRFGFSWNLTHGEFPLVATFTCHAILLTTLLAIALIDQDGHQIPRGLVLCSAIPIALCVMRWPQLHFVPPLSDVAGDEGVRQFLVATLAGVVSGTCMAIAAQLYSRGDVPWRGQLALVFCAALIGLALGWSALVVVLGIAVLIELTLWVGSIVSKHDVPELTITLLISTLCFVLAWRWLDTLRPGSASLMNQALLIGLSLAAALRYVAPARLARS